ncbi:MAG: SLBB domain-containing protein [candidate division KSB1 bacterium]|nr:SLBB domain-containing protein [candidate division KSB1 bacterium]
MRQLFYAYIMLCALLVSPLVGQFTEERKPDTDRTNPFLKSDSYEQLDLLKKYYERIFSEQGKTRAFQFGPDFSRDPSKLFEQNPAGFGLEGRINPAEYIVGPLDVLAINVWGVVPFSYTGPVSPEGSLIIPTIGTVEVAGDTLARAKIKVRQALRKKYESGEITVDLWALRSFKVTVAGVVKSPGAYLASPIDRVDRLVYLAMLSANQTPVSALVKTEEATSPLRAIEEKPDLPISLRNIKLFRANGDTVDVDLVRYYATGDTRYNPYLLDKDVIWVPAENLEGNRISIYGGVRVPGQFEYHENDSLLTLLRIAQGPTALADLEHVEIARFLPDGQQVQTFHVNLHAMLSNGAADIPLQRNDRVFIYENPDLRRERTVFVKGAVQRPGAYALTHRGTTLSEIIDRAGGFKNDAAIAEAKVIRTYDHPDALLKNPDYARLLEVRLTDLSPEGREYFNYESAIKRGFVAVDFVKLFIRHEKAADVTLWENDEIYVPSIHQTVYVYGQVNNPGYVPFVEGMNYRYYLERAGGLSKEANTAKIRVVKRGTKAWVAAGGATIEPGDEIFVARKVRRRFSYYFTIGRDLLQLSIGVATVVLLIAQLQQ